jgi:hypothetical protein
MRQFISPRFWLAIAALIGMTYGLWYVVVRKDGGAALVGTPAAAAASEHRINLIAPVYGVEADPGFAMVGGIANAEMHLVLDASRTMVVTPGTPGDVTCSRLAEINQCVVAADLLGDAVVWFSLIPNPQKTNLLLPGVTEVRKDNWVLLANGWEVSRSEIVERNCDSAGLNDFVSQYGGPLSTSTFSFEKQQIIKVSCLAQPDVATTTIAPTTTLPPPLAIPVDTAIVVDGELPPDTTPVDPAAVDTTPITP